MKAHSGPSEFEVSPPVQYLASWSPPSGHRVFLPPQTSQNSCPSLNCSLPYRIATFPFLTFLPVFRISTTLSPSTHELLGVPHRGPIWTLGAVAIHSLDRYDHLTRPVSCLLERRRNSPPLLERLETTGTPGTEAVHRLTPSHTLPPTNFSSGNKSCCCCCFVDCRNGLDPTHKKYQKTSRLCWLSSCETHPEDSFSFNTFFLNQRPRGRCPYHATPAFFVVGRSHFRRGDLCQPWNCCFDIRVVRPTTSPTP
jgi:hypothetical protein